MTLPVHAVLGELTAALDAHGTAVLVAPPGTGKTTLVPLALAEHTGGRIVVAEPRRLAARAAASRMASLLGEKVGETVGYAVRGDRKVSARTRIEVVTSGLLVRRVQSDPELSNVDIVLLDECHERHLDADLLLALLLDVRAGLREDLKLLATSATVAADRLATLLGEAPVITAHARTFPVEISYLPPVRNERVEASVARAVRVALSEGDGDVLAFLPGAGEIARTTSLLSDVDADVLPLHGRLTAARQEAALTPGPRRRVVLATAVAESSLTVPGVRAVVDSGLSRIPRVDHRRGLSGLATVRVSAAVAAQRAGRAGREAPGRVYRCWPQYEQAGLPAYPEPEIRTADLARLALELACWSTPDGAGLSWWEAPPEGPLEAGQALLHTLGALQGGKITARGRKMATLGLHPRLARALLDGAAEVGPRSAAEVVALLDAGGTHTDVEAELRRLATDQRRRTEVQRLARLVPAAPEAPDPALVVALAHPERLARRRDRDSAVYLMAGGTAAELPAGSGLGDAEWLAVAEATRDPGRAHGIIRLAARADLELALRAAPNLVSEVDEVRWSGDIVARSVRRLGAITLSERPLRDPAPELVRQALLDGLREEGPDLLSWSAGARNLRQRLAFLHLVHGEPWPDMSDDAVLAAAREWLGTARRRADLARIDTAKALRGLLPWPEAARLDELAPERIEVPSGSHVRVDYSTGEPVLAVKLQETFGWLETPRVSGVPVLLHLLSPAGRPVAVTSDLKSFWDNGYSSVRAELRGRYPKHPWPEDPVTATATRHTKRRS
ncbi:ATP-dependent helicase HrpB [Amycolatopsis pithecellobii]|uniref:ATP-dependent helicase HrpB n=1 Tax=Amycolatopsis pithecellobii TaxID=664692 RepID=A0A6N7YVU0_9PSEU|nr:ATP-dependent helicase HrpB [Amycolatopsis pithecellobii]MTD57185.1 ATP-dependent helicase HrpB [Amycolatopsis pithecellobii]